MNIKPNMQYSMEIILNTNKSISFPVVFTGILLLLFFSCKKDVKIVSPATVPVLTTNAANITKTTADIDGKVANNGGSAVIAQGICWGINMNPNIAGDKISIGTSIDSFTIKMTGLIPGTTYYVRAYATNSAGTGYGNQKSFRTLIDVGADLPGFGPFTTVLSTGILHAPVSWNANLPLSDQSNVSGWVLNPPFSDEFNTTSINFNKWYDYDPNTGGGFDPILSVLTTQGMEFHIRKGPTQGSHVYRGSVLFSKTRLLYGYIEASMKMPRNYANSNIFLYAKDPDKWTELDIVEFQGMPQVNAKQAAMTPHIWYSPLTSTHLAEQTYFRLTPPVEFPDEYHIFGFKWTPTKLDWYIDGTLVKSGVNTQWHQPLNISMGTWDTDKNDQLDPALVPILAMKVKYVRVWTAQN
jgi:beta-glucanase (GH16 family)